MKLSEISVEDLRADHDAFVRKMQEVRKQHPPLEPHEMMNGCVVPVSELAPSRHRPNWRQELAARSPFDD